ncbi:hypothetical protein FIU83_01205 [Halomonas sp. THAF5a]|nr:hypothetical protein FIU83_01205 [Halomonas sp. THAF5a]
MPQTFSSRISLAAAEIGARDMPTAGVTYSF